MGYDVKLVGAKLRGLRAEKHVSQQDVADGSGVAANSIALYETDKSGMNLETAWKLADYYDVPLDVLVGRKQGT